MAFEWPVLSAGWLPSLLLPAVFVVVVFYVALSTRNGKMPPGPRPFPFIGNLHLFLWKKPEEVFRDLAKIYGDVFTVHMGPTRVVVLNSRSTIKEALASTAFSGRFDSNHLYSALYPANTGIMLSEGETWKVNRKLCLRHLGEMGFARRRFQEDILKEVGYFMEELRSFSGKKRDVRHLVANATANVICCLVFGKRYNYGDLEFARFMEAEYCVNHAPVLAILMPTARHIPILRNYVKDFENAIRYENEVVSRHFETHKKTRSESLT